MPVPISASLRSRRAETRSRRVLEPGAPALLGPEGLVGQRLIDQRLGDLAAAAGPPLLDRDRDGEMRQRRGGSWWCRPSGSTIHRGLSGLPSISPPSSTSRPQSGRALRSSSTRVCSARLSAIDTKSAGPLAADLQLLDLAEVAAQARRRLARGAGHDGDQAGMGNHPSPRGGHIRGCRRRPRSACPR